MKINQKKLKRNADIGDKFDMVPMVIIVVCLFGIGIFYWFFTAGILSRFFDFLALAVFSAALIVAAVLYGIGKINRRIAKKTVFKYLKEEISGVADDMLRGENIDFTLNLNIRNEAVVFTLTSGNIKVDCDLTAARRLPAMSLIFIAVCTGIAGAKIRDGIAAGRVYKNACYNVVINDDDSPRQYYVKDGVPNQPEIDRTVRIYGNYLKKYCGKNIKP